MNPETNDRVAQAAFEMLEPYAGKPARTVLKRVRGRQRPQVYSTTALISNGILFGLTREAAQNTLPRPTKS